MTSRSLLHREPAVAELRQAIDARVATSTRLTLGFHMGLLAETKLHAGRAGEGLGTIEKALGAYPENRIQRPELLRLRGELRAACTPLNRSTSRPDAHLHSANARGDTPASAAEAVRSSEERAISRATALAWFNEHRARVSQGLDAAACSDVDDLYRQLLTASDRASSRRMYDTMLSRIRPALALLRSHHVRPERRPSPVTATRDTPPDFSSLVGDAKMQHLLVRRWQECATCLSAGAPLAAMVMTGGLLEALLLARINREQNKGSIFTAKAAPKEKGSTATLPLKEWALKNYIDVAHEVGWISQSARDLGVVLRDYRNYVHPYKELSHGVELTADDASLLWELANSIARQLLNRRPPR